MIAKKWILPLCLLVAQISFGQGNLTPSGAPAPTMKTLDQVEPRIPLGSGTTNIIIETAGSYYLTGNIQGSISIGVDNVTLDLMGFRIEGNGDAIDFASGTARDNIRIHNGIISAPSGNGIDFSTSETAANGVIEDLRIGSCSSYGIAVGGGFRIENCVVQGAGGLAGIRAGNNSIVENCTIMGCETGLKLSGSGAYIANNIVKGNTDNYDFTDGNQLNLMLCEVPESIDWPCSVTFAGTLVCTNTSTNGITIASDYVTIDMAGHALIGPGESSKSGIVIAGSTRNMTVMNGTIANWQGAYKSGLHAGAASMIKNVRAYTNNNGLYIGKGSVARDCVASGNLDIGIHANKGCALENCSASDNGDKGIYAYIGNTLHNCAANGNVNEGIHVDRENQIRNCVALENGGDGFCLYRGNIIEHCQASFNSNSGDGAGIHATSVDNRIDGNNCTYNDNGILVNTNGNFIVRNTCSGNGTDYNYAEGNDVGTVQTTPVGAGAWDNFRF